MTSNEAYAWAAGIIDGEGCIALYPCTGGYNARLVVGNTDRRMLDRLADMFGGNVTPMQQSVQPCWRWQLSDSSRIFTALALMEEYLVAKGEQAALMQQYIMTVGLDLTDEIRRRREEICLELRELKRHVPQVTG